MSRYRERGYETRAVQRIMTTERFVKMLRTEEVRRGGKTAARTWGIVSPTEHELADVMKQAKRKCLKCENGEKVEEGVTRRLPMMTQNETMPPAAKQNCANDTAIYSQHPPP